MLNVKALEALLIDDAPQSPTETTNLGATESDIAVVGMSARIGEAESAEAFWQALRAGRDMVREFPEGRRDDANQLRLEAEGLPLGTSLLELGYLTRVDQFDPERFGIAPREAELMDPAQRLFLTVAMNALEDAGYGGTSLAGTRAGVYVGSYGIDGSYLPDVDTLNPASAGVALAGKVNSIIASRLSYWLNLRGPAVMVDTACSSSLAATILACRELRSRTVDLAVVGGLRLGLVPPEAGPHPLGVAAAGGRTFSFDARADGTGGGEGVVALVLKRARQALDDGDHIHGIIRGVAMNQDGASNGLTAPNAGSQAALIREAWRDAGVSPESVSYVEAHGTATPLGDPAEITGLTEAFSAYETRPQACGIGSVKSNVGHLDAAAGIVGLLKVLLMMKHRQIPPSIHFTSPNPEINFSQSPVYVNDRLTAWEGPSPLRAGVSSFGISGTNCHVVVEEPPAVKATDSSAEAHLLALGTWSRDSLVAAVDSLRAVLVEDTGVNLADAAYTCAVGRGHGEYRAAFCFRDRDELLAAMSAMVEAPQDFANVRWHRVVSDPDGPDHLSARDKEDLTRQARDLAHDLPGADRRATLERLADLYLAGADLPWARLYPGQDRRRIPLPPLDDTARRVWRDAGRPRLASQAGHLHPLVHRHVIDERDFDVYESVLEAEGCFELGNHIINDTYVLVGTAFIEMARFITERSLGGSVTFSNFHYRQPLSTRGDEARLVRCVATRTPNGVSCEFRSRPLDGEGWTEHCRVDAALLHDDPAEPVDIRHLVASWPVMQNLTAKDTYESFVSIRSEHWRSPRAIYFGPEGETLMHYRVSAETAAVKAEYSLFPPLVDSGVNIGMVREDDNLYLPLAFERARFFRPLPDEGYWVCRPTATEGEHVREFDVLCTDTSGQVVAVFERYAISRVNAPEEFLRDVEHDRVHEIAWIGVDGLLGAPAPAGKSLVVASHPADRERADAVVSASRGHLAMLGSPDEFGESNMRRLVYQVGVEEIVQIIHLIPATPGFGLPAAELEYEAERALRPLSSLVKTLAKSGIHHRIDYLVVTRRSQAIEPGEPGNAYGRAATAMALSLAEEYSNINIRILDADEHTTGEQIFAAAGGDSRCRVSALRAGRRLEPAMVPCAQSAREHYSPEPIEGDDVVLISGSGGMALAFAEALTRTHDGLRVALINRHVDDHDVTATLDVKARRILSRVDALRAAGASVSLWRADVTDTVALDAAISSIREHYGRIDAVIHTAGLPGDGFLLTKPWEEVARVLAPKVIGAQLLTWATMADDLKVFAMCSSMTGVFGSAGQSDYAAANAFLDGFATELRSAGIRAVSLDWTGWSESGMAAEHGVQSADCFVQFVDDAEGTELLSQGLRSSAPQILLGRFIPEEISTRVDALCSALDIRMLLENAPATSTNERRAFSFDDLVVHGCGSTPLNETGQKVALAWAGALGSREFGIRDKFFESGGNSLLASALQVELDRAFPGIVNIADIFIYSTIAELTEYITARTQIPCPKDSASTSMDADESALSELLDRFLKGDVGIEDIVNEQQEPPATVPTNAAPEGMN